jgi:hypothetical protein
MTDDDIPDGVLSPDELEPDDDRLRQLDERRYVVSIDGETTDGGARPIPEASTGDEREDRSPTNTKPTGEDPATGPALDGLEGAYALAIQARTDGTAAEDCRIDTDDVSVAFEALLRWYAEQVAGDTPHEEALAVLLRHTDIQLPTAE